MVQLGYWLSSEEHKPNELVACAQQAEQVGFAYAQISDHYFPWTSRQGQAPFAWSVIGGIAATTKTLGLGTGVTCPSFRIHPAIIAQAAATAATMMPGRFFLGIGSGELLNEHILGENWPPPITRIDMMREAIQLIRTLWEGNLVTYYGDYFTVENAQIYTLPDQPTPIYVAASGDESVQVLCKEGDGLIEASPNKKVVDMFNNCGGKNKPKYAQLSMCWAETDEKARRTAHEIWPTAAMPPALGNELAIPKYYEETAKLITEDMVAKRIPTGPNPETYIQDIQKYIDAGFDHIALHQIGPDQEGFFNFVEKNILPEFKNR